MLLTWSHHRTETQCNYFSMLIHDVLILFLSHAESDAQTPFISKHNNCIGWKWPKSENHAEIRPLSKRDSSGLQSHIFFKLADQADQTLRGDWVQISHFFQLSLLIHCHSWLFLSKTLKHSQKHKWVKLSAKQAPSLIHLTHLLAVTQSLMSLLLFWAYGPTSAIVTIVAIVTILCVKHDTVISYQEVNRVFNRSQ